MKIAAYLLGLGMLAAGVSFGVSGLQAQQSTLMNFCPAKPGSTSCSAAATMLVSAGNPSDDELIAYITAIADAQRNSRGCGDTAAGLAALVGAIDSESTRGLAQQLVDQLCGVRTAATGGGGDSGLDPDTLHDIVYGVDKGTSPSGPTPLTACQIFQQSSGGTSGNPCGGSSGQTSGGTSGNTSGGTSGQTSGGTSGTSGQSSGTSGQTSGGTSGNTCSTSGLC